MPGEEELKEQLRKNNELLSKISESLQSNKGKNARELILTILLSLATMASAWCSYQSSMWDDEEKINLLQAYHYDEESAKNTLAGFQTKSTHTNVSLRLLENLMSGKDKLNETLISRLDPEFRTAAIEWIALDPLNNPDAPKSPMLMKSYVLEFEEHARDDKLKAKSYKEYANTANDNSDNYLLLTLLFALVLFFAGISGTLNYKVAQILAIVVSIVIFTASLIFVVQLPTKMG